MDKDELLAGRLERVLGAEPANVFARFRAIVGPSNLASFGPLAESARAKLRASPRQPLTPNERAALEVAIRVMRPSALVRDGKPDPLDDQALAQFPDWAAFTGTAARLSAAVGRIDNVRTRREAGTGFLVTPRLIMTNAHVVDPLSFGTMELEPGAAELTFNREFGGLLEPPSAILRVVAVDESIDLALLEIAPPEGREPLVIDAAVPTVGEQVVAVGFPADDPLRNPFFIPLLFGGVFGVKRMAPGEISGVSPGRVAHDCSTLGGNSGSPIVSLRTGNVVAVHNQGTFMFRNGGVDAPTAAAFVNAHKDH